MKTKELEERLARKSHSNDSCPATAAEESHPTAVGVDPGWETAARIGNAWRHPLPALFSSLVRAASLACGEEMGTDPGIPSVRNFAESWALTESRERSAELKSYLAVSDRRLVDESPRAAQLGLWLILEWASATPVEGWRCWFDRDAALHEIWARRADWGQRGSALQAGFTHLWTEGLLRREAVWPDPRGILALEEQFPNFAPVIHFYAHFAALARLAKQPLAPPPALLVGGPGVGKTTFAMALTEILGRPSRLLGMSNSTAGFILGGLSSMWSEACPGEVFRAICSERSMAPLIILDEIDKAATEAKYPPLGPLYQLLEPRTAATFRDEFVNIPFDASQLLWIATANDAQGVPEAIRSRFRVFEIAELTRRERASIASQIFVDVTNRAGIFAGRLDAKTLEVLAEMQPRQMRMAITDALGRAAMRVSVAGQELRVRVSDVNVESNRNRPSIGFVATQFRAVTAGS